MKILIVTFALLLSACGKQEQVATPTAAANNVPAAQLPADLPTVVATATPTAIPTVSVTYYALTKTEHPNPQSGVHTYVVTGYAVDYGGSTYIWDDGVKTVDYGAGTIGYYTYWMLCGVPGNWGPGCGGSHVDLVSAPTLDGQAIANNVENGASTIAAVLSTGTPTTVTCNVNGALIECPDFTIDTAQAPL